LNSEDFKFDYDNKTISHIKILDPTAKSYDKIERKKLSKLNSSMNLNSVRTFYLGIILTTLIIQSFACWKLTKVKNSYTEDVTIIKEQIEIIKKLIERK
jgi:hypothetical protein